MRKRTPRRPVHAGRNLRSIVRLSSPEIDSRRSAMAAWSARALNRASPTIATDLPMSGRQAEVVGKARQRGCGNISGPEKCSHYVGQSCLFLISSVRQREGSSVARHLVTGRYPNMSWSASIDCGSSGQRSARNVSHSAGFGASGSKTTPAALMPKNAGDGE